MRAENVILRYAWGREDRKPDFTYELDRDGLFMLRNRKWRPIGFSAPEFATEKNERENQWVICVEQPETTL